MEVGRRFKKECREPNGIVEGLKKEKIARLKQDFRRSAQHWYVV